MSSPIMRSQRLFHGGNLMGIEWSAELSAALAAAELAGREIMRLYESFEAIADAPAEISTEADQRSQEIILQHLTSHFPNDAYLAEESSATLAALAPHGPRLWIIDPIDGTRGFARKNGEFSVMIALVHESQPAVGVVAEPARSRLTFAVRNQGCWKQDGAERNSRCSVTSTASWDTARLVRSHSEKGRGSAAVEALRNQRFTYSAGIKLALVARGEADLYLSTYPGFHAWDVCAGQILVTEAGGMVTDASGKEIGYGRPGAIHGTVASNRRLQVDAESAM
jgi:3'(2'), 5'-bisphosphate nucleotidase